MEQFDEGELQKLIDEALSQNTDKQHPFGGSGSYLGLAETDLLSSLHERFSKRLIESEVNDIFRDSRTDILSRKISTNLKDLHTVTKNCRKCTVDSNSELPKWNVENPDIVIVVESPSIPPEAITVMVNAFKKAGLNSQQLCLTYVNRCPVRRKYENEEIINCSPYLHLELQLLNPKLILCLGGLPASVIFGTNIKMKDVRGSVTWLGYWPILTTYSPMYVLKSSSFDQNSIAEHFENDILNAYNFLHNKKRTEE